MGDPSDDSSEIHALGSQALDVDYGVRSTRLARLTGIGGLDKLTRLIEQAGAPSEGATGRDGFLSYAAETHALGAGLGVGFTIAAAGELRYFGLVYEGLILGNRGDRWFSGSLLEDVREEKQYFIGGVVAGAVIGLTARVVTEVVSGV